MTNWNLSVIVGTNPVLRCESIHLIARVKSFLISNKSRILSENELYCNEGLGKDLDSNGLWIFISFCLTVTSSLHLGQLIKCKDTISFNLYCQPPLSQTKWLHLKTNIIASAYCDHRVSYNLAIDAATPSFLSPLW